MTLTVVRQLGEEAEAAPHTPALELEPWTLPEPVARWCEHNVLDGEGQHGKPTCLVLVGIPRSGKSKWARSCGRPAELLDFWKVEKIEEMDCTHLVLDDVKWATVSQERKQALADCDLYVSVDHRVQKPVIITCNEEDSPMRDPVMKKCLTESGATVVNLGRRKLYGDSDIDKE